MKSDNNYLLISFHHPWYKKMKKMRLNFLKKFHLYFLLSREVFFCQLSTHFIIVVSFHLICRQIVLNSQILAIKKANYFIVRFEIKGHLLNLVGLFDYNLSILKMFFIFRLVNEPDYLNNFYSKFLKLSFQFLYLTMEVLSLDLYDEFTAHLKNFKFNLVLQHLQLIQQEQLQ